jgi:hypothetical protein
MKSGRIAKLGHRLRTFPDTSLNPNNIIALRHQRNDFHTAHSATFELLEVYITAYEAAESRISIADNISQIQSFINPTTTNLNDHSRRALR